MLESIEKLRELAADINSTEIIDHLDVVGKFMLYAEWLDSWHKAFDVACDEIEAEIAERYMPLPLDADGVPIHVGDTIASDCEIPTEVTLIEMAMAKGEEPAWMLSWGDPMQYGDEDNDWGRFPDQPSSYRHLKPRTLEDVLESFIEDYDHWDEFAHFERGESRNALFARYADEIRKVVGE